MSAPNRQQTHIDRALTNISVAYIQESSAFVADKVFPNVPVQKQSDRYFVYLKEDWFRDEAKERAPGTESQGGGYEVDNTPTYFCNKYAYHKQVTEEDRTNSDSPLDADEDAMQFTVQKMLLKRETLWAQKFFVPNVWDSELVGVDTVGEVVAGTFLKWDLQGSTPIEDISKAKMMMASQTGFRPNTLTLGANVYEALRNHDDILGRIIFTQKGIITADILASLFDVEKVVIAWAVKNIAPKGAAENTDFLLGNHALLSYAPAKPRLKQPTAGYIFPWAGLMGSNAYGMRINRFALPQLGIGTERIEAEMAFDMKIVAQDLGFFFSGVVDWKHELE